jgi:hypothetical protein
MDNKLTATKYCKALNTGIVNSSGHIGYFITDYVWLHENCLQLHSDFHQKEKSTPNYGYICSYNICKLPPLHKDFNNVYAGNIIPDTPDNEKRFIDKEKECFNRYIEDLDSNKLKTSMYSIFNNEITTLNSFLDFEVKDSKTAYPKGIVDTSCCFLKNESYVLDDIVNINGFNEELDGSHGWQDWEFLDRLQTRCGTKLYNNPDITATIIDCRSILYGRLRERGVYSDEAIWKKGKASNFTKDVNTWSLKDMKNNNDIHYSIK